MGRVVRTASGVWLERCGRREPRPASPPCSGRPREVTLGPRTPLRRNRSWTARACGSACASTSAAGASESPGLTADLAAGSRLLVHGLAVDDASLERARKAVEAKGLLGRAIVEKLPLDPLPHVRDLANLVVIEDLDALAAQGPDAWRRSSGSRRPAARSASRRTAAGRRPSSRAPRRWTTGPIPSTAPTATWSRPTALVHFPVGLRWLDGVPMNFNLWAACRGWVIAGGRCFTLEHHGAGEPRPGLLRQAQAGGVPHRPRRLQRPAALEGQLRDDQRRQGAERLQHRAAGDRRPARLRLQEGPAGGAATPPRAEWPPSYPVKYPVGAAAAARRACSSRRAGRARRRPRTAGSRAALGALGQQDAGGGGRGLRRRPGQAEVVGARRRPRRSWPPTAWCILLLQSGNPATEQQIVAVDLQTRPRAVARRRTRSSAPRPACT